MIMKISMKILLATSTLLFIAGCASTQPPVAPAQRNSAVMQALETGETMTTEIAPQAATTESLEKLTGSSTVVPGASAGSVK